MTLSGLFPRRGFWMSFEIVTMCKGSAVQEYEKFGLNNKNDSLQRCLMNMF